MSIDGKRMSYQIAGANTAVVGIYTVEVDATFANSQSQLSFSETFEIKVRHA